MVLDDLPERYVLQYNVLFVRRLVTTAVMMTGRLTQPAFVQLTCVAEELLMRLLLIQAEVAADTFGLLTAEVTTALEVFADGVYEDMDHEWLYELAADGVDEDPDSRTWESHPWASTAGSSPSTRGASSTPMRRTTMVKQPPV
jgi:hypothetical protein